MANAEPQDGSDAADGEPEEGPKAAGGRWVRTRCVRAGDDVRVDSEILSDDASPVTLRVGLLGAVTLVDGDGDAVVSFPGLDGADDAAERFVMRAHFRSLRVWRHSQDSCSSESETETAAGSEGPCDQEPPSAGEDGGGEAGHAGFFRLLYRQPGVSLPWDIGRAQPDFVALRATRPELFASPVLDVGAGFGESSIWLALELGLRVTACDVSSEALREARRRLAHRVEQLGRAAEEVQLSFVEANILDEPPVRELAAGGPFASAVDSAAFHCVGGEEDQRRYVQALAALVRPGGHLILLASSDLRAETVEDPRLRRVSQEELHARFGAASGWKVEELREARYCCVGPSTEGRAPQRLGFPAWLMVARRLES